MGNREAAVVLALGHYSFGPEVHGEMRPVVIALDELVPDLFALLLPRLVLGHEAPEWGEVDYDPVVEVWVPQRGDAGHLSCKGAELGDEGLLGINGPLGGTCLACSLRGPPLA